MAGDLERGDHVTWDSHGCTAEEPQYEVESDTSGRTAVHEPDALHEK